jgi:hypothetical protein
MEVCLQKFKKKLFLPYSKKLVVALLKYKNMHLDCCNCIICSLDIEVDLFHLMLDYPFALDCLSSLNLFILPNSGYLEVLEINFIFLSSWRF